MNKFKHLSANSIDDDDDYPPVLQELVDIHISENETSPNSSNPMIICHSSDKIPFGPTEALTSVFSSGIIQNVQRNGDILVFIPNNTVCKHCSA